MSHVFRLHCSSLTARQTGEQLSGFTEMMLVSSKSYIKDSLRHHTHRSLSECLVHMAHQIGNTSFDWLDSTVFLGDHEADQNKL